MSDVTTGFPAHSARPAPRRPRPRARPGPRGRLGRLGEVGAGLLQGQEPADRRVQRLLVLALVAVEQLRLLRGRGEARSIVRRRITAGSQNADRSRRSSAIRPRQKARSSAAAAGSSPAEQGERGPGDLQALRVGADGVAQQVEQPVVVVRPGVQPPGRTAASARSSQRPMRRSRPAASQRSRARAGRARSAAGAAPTRSAPSAPGRTRAPRRPPPRRAAPPRSGWRGGASTRRRPPARQHGAGVGGGLPVVEPRLLLGLEVGGVLARAGRPARRGGRASGR